MVFSWLPSPALFHSEKTGAMVGSNTYLRVKYHVWPHISGQVLGRIFIDLSRCYSSVKNGPMFGRKQVWKLYSQPNLQE